MIQRYSLWTILFHSFLAKKRRENDRVLPPREKSPIRTVALASIEMRSKGSIK